MRQSSFKATIKWQPRHPNIKYPLDKTLWLRAMTHSHVPMHRHVLSKTSQEQISGYLSDRAQAIPSWHPTGESSARALVAVRLSDAPRAWRCAAIQPSLSHTDRTTRQSGATAPTRCCGQPFPGSPTQSVGHLCCVKARADEAQQAPTHPTAESTSLTV